MSSLMALPQSKPILINRTALGRCIFYSHWLIATSVVCLKAFPRCGNPFLQLRAGENVIYDIWVWGKFCFFFCCFPSKPDGFILVFTCLALGNCNISPVCSQSQTRRVTRGWSRSFGCRAVSLLHPLSTPNSEVPPWELGWLDTVSFSRTLSSLTREHCLFPAKPVFLPKAS